MYYDKKRQKQILNESLTIQELIDILSKYPKDMKIVTTWESTVNPILRRDIYLSKNGKFVYLDADYCSYKQEFAQDANENQEDS